MWPAFAKARWFPALGDGACSNLGSGCLSPDRAAPDGGHHRAMRLDSDAPLLGFHGLWCYRVDRRRFITGGALSNGGDVFAWMKRTLVLPKDLEARLESARPGTHGLTVLPFFSGERTPYWRADLRASITGLSASTEAFDILRAALESVALRFREIYDLLIAGCGKAPNQVIASGGALLHSPGWTQMMADALGCPITVCTEAEASCRGAALWALERSAHRRTRCAAPASTGAVFHAPSRISRRLSRSFVQTNQLYERLYGYSARAARIKLLLMDVDGVLTDGRLINVPAPDGSIFESKAFDSQDGIALQWLSWHGIATGVISGRVSPATTERARQVSMRYVYQGHIEKIPILQEILAQSGISADETAYAGDDLTDVVVMRRVGLAMATANARPEVKRAAHCVTTAPGGQGAVREIAEMLLEAQGHWSDILKKYEVD